MESITSEFLEQYDYYTVANKNEQFGFLLFEKGCLQMQENGNMQTALEYASIVLILHIQVQIANQQMAEKYKASFLEDLLTNNVKTDVEIHNRARLYGWDFPTPTACWKKRRKSFSDILFRKCIRCSPSPNIFDRVT